MNRFVVVVLICAACSGTIEEPVPACEAAPAAAEIAFCDGAVDCPEPGECANVWCWQLQADDPPSEHWGRCTLVRVKDGSTCGVAGECSRGTCVDP
jgi:hypothetical protein